MNDPAHQPDSALREELVAYLDGELPPEEARAVEERLACDEAYRRVMQGFDRAWNALEELPRATVDDSFTKTTIEMVAVAAQQDVAELTQAAPAIRRRRAWWIAGITAVAATLGFALARVVLDYPNRALLSNLPVIQNLDAFNQNITVDFLKRLQADAEDLLQPYEDAELERQVDSLRTVDAASMSQRRDIVTTLTDAEKATLLANQVRFLGLPRAKQQQLLELKDQLRDEPDPKDLQRTMLAYWAWVQEQAPQPGEQAELRGKTTDHERIAMMRALDRREGRITLSEDELSRIREALQEFGKDPRLRQELDRHRKERSPGKEGQHRRSTKPESGLADVTVFSWTARERDERQELARLWDDLQQRILEAVTPQTRQQIEMMERGQQFWFLRRAIFRATRAALQPSETELEQLLTSGAITNDQLQQLLALPKQEMMDELTRINIAEELGADWLELWRRQGGPTFGPGFREHRPRTWEGPFREPRRPDGRGRGPRPPRNDNPPDGPPPADRPFPPPEDGQRPPPPPPEEAAI